MFTGLVLTTATITSVRKIGGGISFSIEVDKIKNIEAGSSIAIDGVCLSAEKIDGKEIFLTAVEETVSKTTLKDITIGKIVNVELPVKSDSFLNGHIVLGHIDCVGKIKEITQQNLQHLFKIEFPSEFNKLVVKKGSIAIDGISLTIVDCGKNWFTVAIIPQTMKNTNLSHKKNNDRVNIEFDIIGKYISNMLKEQISFDENEVASFF